MGSAPAKPITEKHTDIKEGNNLLAGICTMQGWRPEMEV